MCTTRHLPPIVFIMVEKEKSNGEKKVQGQHLKEVLRNEEKLSKIVNNCTVPLCVSEADSVAAFGREWCDT